MISERFDGLVCDLDGVVYLGDESIPGAVEAVTALRRSGTRILFATNNSRATVAQYVAKLGGLGIDVERDEILTSAVVTGEELAARGYSGRVALVVGGDGIREELMRAGIDIVADDATRADLVVVGLDTAFTYETMKCAAGTVRGGAELIATNDDAALPTPEGLWPGAGAIVAAIATAAGARAEVMGKPHRPMMDAAARRLHGARAIAAVGDRPETDLAGARARGWRTILVLSGVTAAEDVRSLEPRPDLVVASLAELAR